MNVQIESHSVGVPVMNIQVESRSVGWVTELSPRFANDSHFPSHIDRLKTVDVCIIGVIKNENQYNAGKRWNEIRKKMNDFTQLLKTSSPVH